MRAALLEQENIRLRFEVERLRSEVERHRLIALKTSPFNACSNLAAALAAASATAAMPITSATMSLGNTTIPMGATESIIRPT